MRTMIGLMALCFILSGCSNMPGKRYTNSKVEGDGLVIFSTRLNTACFNRELGRYIDINYSLASESNDFFGHIWGLDVADSDYSVSDYDEPPGLLHVLSFPAESYVFHQIQGLAGDMMGYLQEDNPDGAKPLPFSVQAGTVKYLGEITLSTSNNCRSFSLNVADWEQRDMAMAISKYPTLIGMKHYKSILVPFSGDK